MMKITIKYLCIAFLVMITLSSCGSSSDKKQTEKHVDLPVKLETVSLKIEGMTCEIGCAKTIESKISKVKGVTESKVDFEAKTGTFTYDANKTSEQGIVNTINGLLNGKTYKATKEKTCCATKEVTSCTKACAEKCGHAAGETCDECSSKTESCCASNIEKECSNKAEEKCSRKEDKAGAKCSEKKHAECKSLSKESCEGNSKKSCCKTADKECKSDSDKACCLEKK